MELLLFLFVAVPLFWFVAYIWARLLGGSD